MVTALRESGLVQNCEQTGPYQEDSCLLKHLHVRREGDVEGNQLWGSKKPASKSQLNPLLTL
jgi:hypothetical protein